MQYQASQTSFPSWEDKVQLTQSRVSTTDSPKRNTAKYIQPQREPTRAPTTLPSGETLHTSKKNPNPIICLAEWRINSCNSNSNSSSTPLTLAHPHRMAARELRPRTRHSSSRRGRRGSSCPVLVGERCRWWLLEIGRRIWCI